ncbi:MAG TPA: adenylate/guanylate cyclase domain-containing protein [Myxococcaceae bacterium]|nr:adenylate/guanylate cyclase domain-containing protein [Myxococcaceae bacterium]
MLPQRFRWVGRRRYELVGLAVAVTLGLLHWATDGRQAGARSGPVAGVLRVLSALEGRASDLQMWARGVRAPHPDVVVAAIDEHSVQRYGRWPWSRELLARAVVRLHEAGPAAIGLDITFTDEDHGSDAAVMSEAAEALGRALGDLPESSRGAFNPVLATLKDRASGTGDAALARALADAPEVVQGVSAYGSGEAQDYLEQREVAASLLHSRMLTRFPGPTGKSFFEVPLDRSIAERFVSAQVPLPTLLPPRQPLGHFNVLRDDDGVVRFTPPFVQLEHPPGLLPSLELQTAATALRATIEPVWDPELGQLVGARLRRDGHPVRFLPLTLKRPRARIDYPGPSEVFRTVSLADVVDRKLPDGALRGKVLLVGVTLVGQYDQVVTPFRNLEAGIYAHAAMLSSVLSGRLLQRGTGAVLAELVFILGAGLLLGLVLPRASPWLKAIVPLALALGWMAVVQLALRRGVVLASALPLANVFLSAFAIVFVGYLSTDREKIKLRRTFRYYVAESVMTEMLEHPELLRLGGEKRDCTVLFSDIRGFTAISETMAPEALVKFINGYLSPMTRIVLEEGGTLDKYIGDALMAFWGAPVPQEDHALRACRTALRFLEELEQLRRGWRAEGLPEIEVGVGINSGPMVVGNMGSDLRFDYTVMGDAVNMASRLEGANKLFQTSIMVSEETWNRIASQATGRRLGSLRLRGRSEPVRVWELLALRPPSPQEEAAIARFEAAVDALAARRVQEAEAGFQAVLADRPDDRVARRYLSEARTSAV